MEKKRKTLRGRQLVLKGAYGTGWNTRCKMPGLSVPAPWYRLKNRNLCQFSIGTEGLFSSGMFRYFPKSLYHYFLLHSEGHSWNCMAYIPLQPLSLATSSKVNHVACLLQWWFLVCRTRLLLWFFQIIWVAQVMVPKTKWFIHLLGVNCHKTYSIHLYLRQVQISRKIGPIDAEVVCTILLWHELATYRNILHIIWWGAYIHRQILMSPSSLHRLCVPTTTSWQNS